MSKKTFEMKMLQKNMFNVSASYVTLALIMQIVLIILAVCFNSNAINAFAILFPLFNLGIFFSTIITSAITNFLDVNKNDSSERERNIIASQGLILSIIFGLILFGLFITFINLYLKMFNLNSESFIFAKDISRYFKYVIALLPLNNYLSTMLKLTNNLKAHKVFSLTFIIAFIFLAYESIQNYGLSGIFIVMFVLEVFEMFLAIRFVFNKNNDIKIGLRPNFKAMKYIFKVGITDATEKLIIFIFELGVLLLASKLNMLAYTFILLSIFNLSYVLARGKEDGAKLATMYLLEHNYDGIKKTFEGALKITALKGIILVVIINLLARFLGVLYVADSTLSPAVLEFGIRIISIAMFCYGIIQIYNSFIKFYGSKKINFISLLLTCIVMPALFITTSYFVIKTNCILYGITASMIVTLLILAINKIITTNKLNVNENGNAKIYNYGLHLNDNDIVKTKDEIFNKLKDLDVDKKKINIISMVIEDYFILIKENNEKENHKNVWGEVTLMIRPDGAIRLIFKDNGIIAMKFDNESKDSDDNLRLYLINNVLKNKTKNDFIKSMSINRSQVEFR